MGPTPRGFHYLLMVLLPVLSEADEVMVEFELEVPEVAEVVDETAEELTVPDELRAAPVPVYGNCLL